jgi:integrase
MVAQPFKAGLLRKPSLPFFPPRVLVPRSAAHVGDAAARGRLRAEGVHPKVVQERLGHSQISVTVDTYSHVLPTMQAEAAGKFDDMLARTCGFINGSK